MPHHPSFTYLFLSHARFPTLLVSNQAPPPFPHPFPSPLLQHFQSLHYPVNFPLADERVDHFLAHKLLPHHSSPLLHPSPPPPSARPTAVLPRNTSVWCLRKIEQAIPQRSACRSTYPTAGFMASIPVEVYQNFIAPRPSRSSQILLNAFSRICFAAEKYMYYSFT